jgi:hypothetical protein
MSDAELRFIGIQTPNRAVILLSDDQVRRLREELSKALDSAATKWDAVHRRSEEQTSRYLIS